MLVRSGFALVLSLALTSAAFGQEILRNDPAQADPKPVAAVPSDADQADPEANGAWARAVMNRATDDKKTAQAKSGCERNPDRAPHGEVWAGAGTNGYRDIGGVVTKPVGDCATLTVGYEQGSIGYGRGRRGR